MYQLQYAKEVWNFGKKNIDHSSKIKFWNVEHCWKLLQPISLVLPSSNSWKELCNDSAQKHKTTKNELPFQKTIRTPTLDIFHVNVLLTT